MMIENIIVYLLTSKSKRLDRVYINVLVVVI